MSDGLSAVLARISQIETLISPAPAPSPTAAGTSASSSDFQNTLDQVGTGSGTDPGTGTTSGGTGSSSAGDQAVAVATRYLGTPYRWGGIDPSTGLDCSGFTQLVYKQVGVSLPRVSADQARVGTAVASLAQAQPGDLVFFGSPVHHVGIYVGGGKMIDAPRTGEKVKIQSIYETPSQIRRVLATATLASSSRPDLTGTGLPLSGTPIIGSLGNTPYAALFRTVGQSYGIDPALLSAVAKTESGYDADAVSPSGARGLMQLTPTTAKSLGVDPTDPTQAVQGAARLLSDNLRTFNGRVDLALAAYDAGPAAVRKYNGVPPYRETRDYVQRVQENWGKLR